MSRGKNAIFSHYFSIENHKLKMDQYSVNITFQTYHFEKNGQWAEKEKRDYSL